MQSGLLSRIKFARARKFVLALLAVFIVLTLNYAAEIPQRGFGAGITVIGNTINFGSGYYTIDSSGKVYEKTGSEIENTPADMYPYVSYLSNPYMYGGSQLTLAPDTNIVVANGATVLMEGSQTFGSLTVQAGGVVSQPQPDRNGKINRYQYSDQEWGVIFYGYLRVNNGEKRKLTCPDLYYVDSATTQGNGCVTSFSTTLNTDIFSLNDWQNFDQVWQTGVGAFDQTRYNFPPGNLRYINNTSGSTQYYPVRIKFKNDNRDNRIEPMRVVLRDDTDAIIGSADGVDMNLIYGVAQATGLVDSSADGQARMNMQYYLLDQYIATPAQPTLGWILEDFSNAYKTYETYMDNAAGMKFTNFFDNNYGERTNGIFDLQFDDRNAYDATYASSPFAKGTTGAVYDSEVYRNYAFSAKAVNPNIENYPSTRYVNAGLKLMVRDDVIISGGYIDVSGKGFPGYSMELRTESDGVFMNNRGAGVDNAGGLSTDYIPQSAAHYKYDLEPASFGNGGSGFNDGAKTGKNTNVYNEATSLGDLDLLGSGAGAASAGNAIPSHGGNGGGYVFLQTTNLTFTVASGGIKANGSNGYQIAGGSLGSGGGSGGTVEVSVTNLRYPVTGVNTKFFEAQGGVEYYEGSPQVSSGGGGGFVGVYLTNFYYDGAQTFSKDKIKQSINVAGGIIGDDDDYFGDIGRYIIQFQPSPVLNFPDFIEGENSKTVNVTPYEVDSSGGRVQVSHDNTESYQIFPDDDIDIRLTVKGMTDGSRYDPVPVDIIVVSDTTGSMDEYYGSYRKIDWLKSAIRSLLTAAASNNIDNPNQINLGLVNFNGTEEFLAPGDDLSSCEANRYNPFGIVCSDSYNHNNFMTTNTNIFTNQYITHVNGYRPFGGTSAGAGLNNAINHLTDLTYSRPAATTRKFIMFVTDGMENLPTCITGPTDTHYHNRDGSPWTGGDRYLYPACDDSIARFSPNMGTPITNYPLDRIKENNIGMVSIATIPPTGDTPNPDYYKTFLTNISQYARPFFYSEPTPVFYDVVDLSTLQQQMENALFSIINAPQAMPITVSETLPLGVEVDMSNPPQVDGKPGAACNVIPAGGFGSRQKVECTIKPSDYNPSVGYDQQNFVVSIHAKAGSVESGSYQDIDQNYDYEDIGCGNEAVSPMYIGEDFNSFVEYNPQGPYNSFLSDSKKKKTPSICKQFFSNVVKGDVYSSSGYLNNFAFYGRNLNQASGSNTYSGVSWPLLNYSFNPQAQGSYLDNQKAYLDSRITLLQGEATIVQPIDLESNSTWNLQSGIINRQATQSEINSYPEGKVWLVNGNVNLSNVGSITYRGKGTIIIDGNLTVRSGINISPNNSSVDFLGIVVKGNTIFEGNNNIRFANLTLKTNSRPGNIEVNGSNVRAIGSFVASSFSFGVNATNRIRFYYDSRLDSFWPPGFRYFNMPTAKNTAP